MKSAHAVFASMLVVATCGCVTARASDILTAPTVYVDTMAELTGAQYRAITTAIAAVEEKYGRPLNLAAYKFITFYQGEGISVGIADALRPEEMLGASGRVPEYDIELTADGLHVLYVGIVND